MIIIAVLSALSTYQFIDTYSRFRFLFIDIVNNLTNEVVIYMLIVFMLSITSYGAFIFNWKLLKVNLNLSETDLIDDFELKKSNGFRRLNDVYIVFSGLLIGLGIFIIFKSIQAVAEINDLATTIVFPLFIAAILIGLGFMFITDGIKTRRSIKPL